MILILYPCVTFIIYLQVCIITIVGCDVIVRPAIIGRTLVVGFVLIWLW